MNQLLFIGGLGSNRAQVDFVADLLSSQYQQEVIGLPFSYAQKNMAHVAKLAQDSVVITHSAGILLCENITPSKLIAIAPSLPASISTMVWRTVAKTIALVASTGGSPDRTQRVQAYNARVFREHLVRPQYNVGQALRICRFDPAQLAVKMINRGTPVTLGFMRDDVLYPMSARHAHVDTAKSHGVTIHEGIAGHHDEFLLYPLEVLDQLSVL